MNTRIALCLDEATCRNPELVGLGGEAVESQNWLDLYTAGEEARQGAATAQPGAEAWVVSCDDVEPINLAATMKADRPELHVCLVTTEWCGSLMSRAHTAGIDEVLDIGAFVKRYAQAKRMQLGVQEPLSAAGSASEAPVANARGGAAAAPSVRGETPAKANARSEIVAEPLASADAHPASPGAVAPQAVKALLDGLLSGQNNVHAGSAGPRGAAFPAVLDAPVALEPQLQMAPSFFLDPQAKPGALAVGSASRAFVLTVVSGSGGAGKSSVSAVGALIARSRGFRTLLLDCDLQFGDVAAMVGAKSPLAVDEALEHPDRLEQECAGGQALTVIAAPARLEAAEGVVQHLPSLMDFLVTRFDVIVVNTGATWAEQHAALLERSSAALFLVDQRVSSIRACQHALDLCARCGIATGPFRFALNRCAKGAPLSSADVSCALQGANVYELKDGGRDVEDYLSGGAAEDLLQTKNEFAKSLEYVLDQMLPPASGAPNDREPEPAARRSIRRRGRHMGKKRGW